MKTKYGFSNILFTFITILLVFFIGFNGNRNYNSPKQVFQVYLNGEVIGVIDSKEKLVKMIDEEQEEIKEKYGVSNVHIPKNLEIKSIVTYSGRLDNIKSVYEKIKETEKFTIEGYELTIKKNEKIKKVFLLNKKDLDISVESVVLAFLDNEKYLAYMNSNQKEIIDVGEYIENISLGQEVTIKPAYISTDETIFINSTELTRYLLFGTLETQKIYKIKSGDTIESVAEKNKLSVDEFIIANPNIKSKDILLYPGQEVNIALINPVLDIVVVTERVEIQNVAYSTKYEYDYTIAANSSIVKQAGLKGKSKVTFKVQTINGQDASVLKTNTVVLSAPVTKIVLRGSGTGGGYISTDGDWGWPTVSGYSITSFIGWRWGSYHYGVDIAGTGYGSPIFAAADGVIIDQAYGSSSGNYVTIDHRNGYKSKYLHLKNSTVKIGDIVSKGQKIGSMGNTGTVWPLPSKYNPTAGTHLHFEVWYNGQVINPLALY